MNKSLADNFTSKSTQHQNKYNFALYNVEWSHLWILPLDSKDNWPCSRLWTQYTRKAVTDSMDFCGHARGANRSLSRFKCLSSTSTHFRFDLESESWLNTFCTSMKLSITLKIKENVSWHDANVGYLAKTSRSRTTRLQVYRVTTKSAQPYKQKLAFKQL